MQREKTFIVWVNTENLHFSKLITLSGIICILRGFYFAIIEKEKQNFLHFLFVLLGHKLPNSGQPS